MDYTVNNARLLWWIYKLLLILLVSSHLGYTQVSCPNGDTTGVVKNGQTCDELVTSSPAECYNTEIETSCCGSCNAQNTGVAGCEFGDRVLCFPFVCATLVIQADCCETCRSTTSTVTPATTLTTTIPTTTSPTTPPTETTITTTIPTTFTTTSSTEGTPPTTIPTTTTQPPQTTIPYTTTQPTLTTITPRVTIATTVTITSTQSPSTPIPTTTTQSAPTTTTPVTTVATTIATQTTPTTTQTTTSLTQPLSSTLATTTILSIATTLGTTTTTVALTTTQPTTTTPVATQTPQTQACSSGSRITTVTQPNTVSQSTVVTQTAPSINVTSANSTGTPTFGASSQTGGNKDAAIIGGTIGGLVGVSLITGGVLFGVYRWKQKNRNKVSSMSGDELPPKADNYKGPDVIVPMGPIEQTTNTTGDTNQVRPNDDSLVKEPRVVTYGTPPQYEPGTLEPAKNGIPTVIKKPHLLPPLDISGLNKTITSENGDVLKDSESDKTMTNNIKSVNGNNNSTTESLASSSAQDNIEEPKAKFLLLNDTVLPKK